MSDIRKHSATSNIVRFVLKHSTTGQGLTGLTSASSGLVISTITSNEATATVYTVASSNVETITTLGTFAAPTASKCRFKEVDATNHKGLYEFQFADARFSVSNAKRLVVSVSGASNLLDTDYEILLTSFDPHDAVRMGLTALPNAVAGANGGLPLGDANARVDIIKVAGTTQTARDLGANLDAAVTSRMATYTQPTGFLAATFPTTVASTTNITAGTLTTVTNVTNAPTSGDLTATMKTSVTTAATAATPTVTAGTVTDKTGYALSSGGVQAIWDALTSAFTTASSIGKKLADWTIGTAQTGDSYARLGAPAGASIAADIAAVTAPSAAAVADAVWDETLSGHLSGGSTGAALNAAGSAGDPWATAIPGAYGSGTAGKILGDNVNATVSSRASQTSVDTVASYIDTEVAAIKAKTDNLPADPASATGPVGSVTGAVGSVTAAVALTSGERNSVADAILARALATESYATNGAVPTLSQALYMMLSEIGQFSISGTTLTCKKLNGTTASMTFTLDDATTPTARVRAT